MLSTEMLLTRFCFSSIRYSEWVREAGGHVCGSYQELKSDAVLIEELVLEAAVAIEPGFLYEIDMHGVVRRRRQGTRDDLSLVCKLSNFEYTRGFKYYLDPQGNVKRTQVGLLVWF
jgi:hypothetical protein